ncbi:hypothetical protein WOLCODRAFT_67542 [Wolfiporia cocos MD-104 SS10]|uniref:Uncharacterized protein n=1 Tax=Wolfiporia cocos (strain MD-104) TaxID=742152 RepID=A0A2H3JDX1_WOLCO|nr:hypothetical protein WOLCODRAFT_67542 [Wolfiporia cocos MD-104 SS10]
MFPLAVSHVCRAWRRLALRTPALWRRISLDHRLHMWRYRLYLAKACTLDIQLGAAHTSEPPRHRQAALDFRTVRAYMQLVHPLVGQWRSLDIRFDTPSRYLWRGAISGCCGGTPAAHALHMEKLTLAYPGNDDPTEYILFGGSSPALRRATLCGIRLTWHPGVFGNLSHLDYTHHGFTCGRDAAAEVLRMLQTSSRLVELRLAFPWRGDGATRAPAAPRRAVTLARLAALTVSIEGPDVPSALLLVLAHTSAPALRVLRLRSCYPFRRPAVFPSARHVPQALPACAAVERVYVEHGWLDPRLVFALLPRLPRLAHLAVRGARVTGEYVRALAETLRARRALCAAPQLEVLELVRCENVTAEELVRALRPRSGSAAPCVQTLSLNQCSGVSPAKLRKLKGAGISLSVC